MVPEWYQMLGALVQSGHTVILHTPVSVGVINTHFVISTTTCIGAQCIAVDTKEVK